MQASTQTRKVKHQRPNLVTAPELNALIGELKAEMAQLKHQVSELSATVAGLQQPVLVQQSPRQALRWSAIKAVKDSLKAGTSIEDTKTMLGDSADFQMLFQGTDKQQAIEGILKIALIQAGKRS